jgi:Fe-S oxidoreductase
MKRLADMAPEREFPPYADPPFRSWFARAELMPAGTGRHADGGESAGRHHGGSGSRRVLLWPDTFNAYFTPGPLQAAAHVLSEAGYQVEIPRKPLCCGRPLYAPGMLTLARRLWRRTLKELRPYIREDVPIVVLEPSCASAFRDELPNLFHADEDARRLSRQAHLLSEFLEMQGYEPPKREGRAVVHGHCHHRAIMQMEAELAVLKKMGLDIELLDDTCCGMAGDFGFRRKTYDVAMKSGEYSFLPALRRTPEDTLFLANGFSCREQARQVTGRMPLTIAEVLHQAVEADHDGAAQS